MSIFIFVLDQLSDRAGAVASDAWWVTSQYADELAVNYGAAIHAADEVLFDDYLARDLPGDFKSFFELFLSGDKRRRVSSSGAERWFYDYWFANSLKYA